MTRSKKYSIFTANIQKIIYKNMNFPLIGGYNGIQTLEQSDSVFCSKNVISSNGGEASRGLIIWRND